jgi:hypothetical protein
MTGDWTNLAHLMDQQQKVCKTVRHFCTGLDFNESAQPTTDLIDWSICLPLLTRAKSRSVFMYYE